MTERKTKNTTEWKHLPGDRSELVRQANNTILTLMYKTKPWGWPQDSDAKDEFPMSPDESQCYNAALNFLTDQFRKGVQEGELYISREDQDETVTWDDDDSDSKSNREDSGSVSEER